jgi:hypothetical protein
MHININKLVILVAAAITGEGATGSTCGPGRMYCFPGEFDHSHPVILSTARCYASSMAAAASSGFSMTKRQSQMEMEYSSSSPASHNSLRRGDGDMRKLATEASEATVIHYKENSWTLSRDEVVEAVEQVMNGAETHFQLNEIASGEDASLEVFLITEDGMNISTEDLDEAFAITNAFIEKSPDIKYQVDCPAKGDGDTCTVKVMGQQDEAGSDLVTCFAEDSTITKEDIPAECGGDMYDMALYALPGPHFILAGTTKSLDSSSVNPICPKSIAFSTIGGKKQIVFPYMEDIKDLSKHTLGVAALADILKAEENAEAIDEASYDMLKNNCVHYASSIWRRLEIDETEDLGNFVVHNIVIDEGLLENLASKVQGGRRLLKALLNKRHEEFVKNVVYEYFNLN